MSGKRFSETPPAASAGYPVELPPYRPGSLKLRPSGRIESVVEPIPQSLGAQPEPWSEPQIPARRKGRSRTKRADERERLTQTQEKHALYLRRKAKRSHMLQRRLRSLLRLLLVVVTVLFVPTFLQAACWRWNPADTQMQWDGYTQPGAVTRILKPYARQPLWAVNPADVERRLKKVLPVVASVQVRRHLLPAHIEVSASEHRPWALLFEPPGARQASDAEGMSGAQPYAVIAEAHQPIVLAPGQFRWQALTRAHPQIPILLAHDELKRLKSEQAQQLFSRLDTVIQNFQQVERLHLRDISLDNNLAVTAHFEELDVPLGPLDSDNLDKASRLNPLVRTLTDEQLANLDRIDLRWEKNVFWHQRHESDA